VGRHERDSILRAVSSASNRCARRQTGSIVHKSVTINSLPGILQRLITGECRRCSGRGADTRHRLFHLAAVGGRAVGDMALDTSGRGADTSHGSFHRAAVGGRAAGGVARKLAIGRSMRPQSVAEPPATWRGHQPWVVSSGSRRWQSRRRRGADTPAEHGRRLADGLPWSAILDGDA